MALLYQSRLSDQLIDPRDQQIVRTRFLPGKSFSDWLGLNKVKTNLMVISLRNKNSIFNINN